MTTKTEFLTTKLNNGRTVLAKYYEGRLCSVGYANRTQATKKLRELGDGWDIYQPGRPFYIAKAERK